MEPFLWYNRSKGNMTVKDMFNIHNLTICKGGCSDHGAATMRLKTMLMCSFTAKQQSFLKLIVSGCAVLLVKLPFTWKTAWLLIISLKNFLFCSKPICFFVKSQWGGNYSMYTLIIYLPHPTPTLFALRPVYETPVLKKSPQCLANNDGY